MQSLRKQEVPLSIDDYPGKATPADLSFIVPQADKPLLLSAAYTGGEPEERFKVQAHHVDILDMRPNATDFSLDQQGFALRRWPVGAIDLKDDVSVDQAYIPMLIAYLRKELQAREVVIFDVTRRSDSTTGASNRDGARGPASRVHVDYTRQSGPARARMALGDEAFERHMAAGRRIVQVNAWRSTGNVVRRSPLTLADARSIDPRDLVATDQLFPERRGEIYHLAYRDGQRWYYAPEMDREEALLIKGWDSLEPGVAQFTPHSAFHLPDHDTSPFVRESIEARAIAVI